jgi:hypothetical protein
MSAPAEILNMQAAEEVRERIVELAHGSIEPASPAVPNSRAAHSGQ